MKLYIKKARHCGVVKRVYIACVFCVLQYMMFPPLFNAGLLFVCLAVSLIFSAVIWMNVDLDNTLASLLWIGISVGPPFFYRPSYRRQRENVMIVHMITVVLAMYYTFNVNSIMIFKGTYDDELVTFSSIACVTYSLTIVFGHFMKSMDKEKADAEERRLLKPRGDL